MNENLTKEYRITARNKEQLLMFESFLEWISYLCRVGSSRELKIFIDGDGALELQIESLDGELIKWSDGFNKGYGKIRFDNNREPYYWDLE